MWKQNYKKVILKINSIVNVDQIIILGQHNNFSQIVDVPITLLRKTISVVGIRSDTIFTFIRVIYNGEIVK